MKGVWTLTSSRKDFKNGDWIMHPTFGVGRVKKVETKRLNGQRNSYVRVEAEESTYWILVEGIEETHARKVLSKSGFRSAIRLLKNKPRKMDARHKKRHKRISEVMSAGFLRPTIRLLRDLWARDRKHKLNDTEKAALRTITENLVDEWTVVESISPKDADANLKDLLDKHRLTESQAPAIDPLGQVKEAS
jgi:CarD family transcriptional regulator